MPGHRTTVHRWTIAVTLIIALLGLIPLQAGAAESPATKPSAPAAAAKADVDNAQWAITLPGFFPGEKGKKTIGPKRLNCYLVRRDGKWVSALATPTNSGRPVWNSAIMLVDPAGLNYADGKLKGTLAVTLVPDPWIPADRKARQANVTLDAAVAPKAGDGESNAFAEITGTWKSQIPGAEAELADAQLQPRAEGEIIGGVGTIREPELKDASYDLAVYDMVPGTTTQNFQRRRALSLGIKGGKVVSARIGQMDMRGNAYDFEQIDTPEEFKVTPDAFAATVSLTTDALNGDRVEMTLTFQGQRVDAFLAGTWTGSYTDEAGKSHDLSGFFRGTAKPGAFESAAAKDDRPWFNEVKGFDPPKPGEHPRLFFRKSDLPELRRRAQTPEGKQIIQRLREMLNGSDGESMPTSYNPATQAYEKNGYKAPVGAYTISHGAGFGFLYQMTGDKKYADFARLCMEKAWAGQRSADDRYSWIAPGGELRAGPSLAWYAVAYDLCYDAWPEDFRKKAALAIQNYSDVKGGEWNRPEGITLDRMVLQPRQGPGSNHHGAVVGGCGIAVLAIRNDPGIDAERLEKYLSVLERQLVRNISAGWGDGGYYKEGWGASRVGTRSSLLPFLQALRVAAGRDYVNVERPNASYITMVPRCLMVLRGADHAYFPYRSNMGATYGNPELGTSSEGYYSEGFGAVADRFKPGLLWTYNHLFSPDNKFQFDTTAVAPHRAMLALINWPTFSGVAEANPAEAMPLVTRDHLYEYFVFRNGFTAGPKDVVTTVLVNYPDGTKPRDVMVWGMGGLRLTVGEPEHGAPVTHFVHSADGSGSLTAGDWAMAVDYSGASGADALIATAGNSKAPELKESETKSGDASRAKLTTLDVGGKPVSVLTLSASGKHPQPKVEGNKVVVGGQTITYADGQLTLGKFQAAP